ncbi:MAG: hypothetical protein ACK54Y_09980 [Bacteroidota bacterium]|jgi:hypothetical protein
MSTYSLNQLLGNSTTNFSSLIASPRQFTFSANSYERNEEASFAGVFCLVIPIIFTYFCIATNTFYDAFNVYLNIIVTGGLIFRVIAYNWVGNIAREQNRNQDNWQLFSTIFPSIALLTLGYTTQLPAAVAEVEKAEKIEETSAPAIILQANMEQQVSEEELLRKAS